MQETHEGPELLHRLRGTVEVATNLIDRSVALCARSATDGHVLERLADAARALAVVSDALDGELRAKTLGPAA
jgi:hypothetical protein